MKTFSTLISALTLAIFGVTSLSAQNITVNAYPQPGEALAASSASSTFPDSIVGKGKKLYEGSMPVELTAADFIERVYGVFDPTSSKAEICENCRRVLSLSPSEEEMGLWLDSAEGYRLNYYGIEIPEVSAMAQIENDSVCNYGFFFMFPYSEATKGSVNERQCAFCGALLQEMHDMGVDFNMGDASDSLFEAFGDYKGKTIDVRLADEDNADNSGRFILYFVVEPGGITTAAL